MSTRTKDVLLFLVCGVGGFVLCWLGFWLCIEVQ